MRPAIKIIRHLLAVCVLAGGTDAFAAGDDVYVWQRRWTPALSTSLQQASPLVHAWRVLVGELQPGGRLLRVQPDLEQLRRSGRPVVLVLRIDGRLPDDAGVTVPGQVGALLRDWRDQGIAVSGVEIDHDCGTARLPAYGELLRAVRAALPPDLRLSITALPAWLGSDRLDALLRIPDETVLQVHAVQDPRRGLFDPVQAQRWAVAWAQRTGRPFRVALPTYAVQVGFAADGRLQSVEGERAMLDGGANNAELISQPAAVAELRRELLQHPPAGFDGFAWFRLPSADDRRAWSPALFRAILQGQPLAQKLRVESEPGSIPGMRQLLLVNDGALDAVLPKTVSIDAACKTGDGVGAYAVAAGSASLQLRRLQPGFIRAHGRQVIGWLRCDPEKVRLDAED